MGNFLSKLITGNPFAQGSVGDTLKGSLGGAIPGMPQTSLQSILGGKGGQQQQLPSYLTTPPSATGAPVAPMNNIMTPQKFGGGLIGASRRRFGG